MRGKALVQCASSSPPGITPAYAGKSRGQSRNCTNTEDHPRVCGEKAKAFYMKPLEEGSPPRMRGKVPAGLCQIIGFGITPAYAGKSCTELTVKGEVKDHPRVCGEKPSGVMAALACAGITPAYAGKSTNSELSSPCTRDHPRVCGEKHTKGQTRPRVAGSPPRMRGKARSKIQILFRYGITPAYAGKRASRKCFCAEYKDHPRVCGEKRHTTKPEHSKIGSPPRMRGKAVVILLCVATFRITPAYAGKSCHPHLKKALPGDHPRVCGEKYSLALFLGLHRGSPPRMRGKVDVFFTFVIPGRITPAYAGKRISLHTVCRCLWDHPRVCGEKVTDFHLFWHFGGSPPRMRGKETGKTRRVQWPGITPAYAGKSMYCAVAFRFSEDHPRVCGEKCTRSPVSMLSRGSPPRMRGKEREGKISRTIYGITPAYAGKSMYRTIGTPWHRDHPRVCGEKAGAVAITPFTSGSPPRMRGKV